MMTTYVLAAILVATPKAPKDYRGCQPVAQQVNARTPLSEVIPASDSGGYVRLASATGCRFTFGRQWPTVPVCLAQIERGDRYVVLTITRKDIFFAGGKSGDIVAYRCTSY